MEFVGDSLGQGVHFQAARAGRDLDHTVVHPPVIGHDAQDGLVLVQGQEAEIGKDAFAVLVGQHHGHVLAHP